MYFFAFKILTYNVNISKYYIPNTTICIEVNHSEKVL